MSGITKLVAGILKDMKASDELIPEPLSLRKFQGKIAVRVPPQQHRQLAIEAAEQGVSLNRLISQKLAR